MIWESEPWKRDLENWRTKLAHRANNYDSRSYITVEKAIFYSAFIMRKLFDCPTKIRDTTKQLKIPTERYTVPIEKINLLKHIINEDDFLSQRAFHEQRRLKEICGILIHSLAFELIYNEGKILGFFVTSDNCNVDNEIKNVFFINIKDWLSCMETIIADEVTSIHYSAKKKGSIWQYEVKVN